MKLKKSSNYHISDDYILFDLTSRLYRKYKDNQSELPELTVTQRMGIKILSSWEAAGMKISLADVPIWIQYLLIICYDFDLDILNDYDPQKDSNMRDYNLYESALQSGYASFGGTEFFPTPEERITRMWYSLIKNHPLVDRNKTNAGKLAKLFFTWEDVNLTYNPSEAIKMGYAVASGDASYEDLLEFVKTHASHTNFYGVEENCKHFDKRFNELRELIKKYGKPLSISELNKPIDPEQKRYFDNEDSIEACTESQIKKYYKEIGIDSEPDFCTKYPNDVDTRDHLYEDEK